MTDARRETLWHRTGPVAAVGALALVAAAQACSSSSSSATGAATATTGKTTTATTGSGGMGGMTTSTTGTGGMGGAGGMPTGPLAVTAEVNGAQFSSPFDVTLDPTGKNFFFTALDGSMANLGVPGVFTAPAAGGKASVVAEGGPLVAPFGISTSTDGMTIFVADPATNEAMTDGGAIYSVSSTPGGTFKAVMGTAGTLPRGLQVSKQGNADVIYYTGYNSTDSLPEVYSVPSAGGVVAKIAEGAPLVDPSGIAVTNSGDCFVADASGSATSLAVIYRIPKGGMPSVAFDSIRVGYPAGLALSEDETQLLISTLDPAKGSQVIQIDLGTMKQTVLSPAGSPFWEPAGLHRAASANVFGWADATAQNTGTVFVIK